MKFEPLMVKINSELPAATAEGLSDNTEGAGFEVALIVNSADLESPPPGAGLVTLTAAEPELAMSVAVI